MNCQEFQDRISAVVDRLLHKDELDSFFRHADTCPGCRHEYESESLTKQIVRQKVQLVRAPGPLVQRILEQLEHDEQKAPTAIQRLWGQLSLSSYLKPAIALGTVGILVFLISTLTEHSPAPSARTASNSVIDQSLANYQAIAAGAIKPQHVARSSQQLSSFFAGKTDFPVQVPELEGYTLLGGVLNEHAGTTLAHVVYLHGDEMIYMYEACWNTVMQGQKLEVPQPVREQLLKTGLYAESMKDGRTVVLWTKGNTLCAAVARMDKDDLVARLKWTAASGTRGNW